MAASAPHGDRFLVGVNYWPADKFVRVWRDFCEDQIAHGFATAKAFGIDLIRFFLTWEDFQPRPDEVSARQFGNLEGSSQSPTVYGCA